MLFCFYCSIDVQVHFKETQKDFKVNTNNRAILKQTIIGMWVNPNTYFKSSCLPNPKVDVYFTYLATIFPPKHQDHFLNLTFISLLTQQILNQPLQRLNKHIIAQSLYRILFYQTLCMDVLSNNR